MRQPATDRVPLAVLAREWARIGCIGFGGPPAHIASSASCASNGAGGCRLASSKTASPPPISSLAPPRPSWPSTAPGVSVAAPVRWSVDPASSSRGSSFLGLAVLFLGPHPPGWVEGAAGGAGAAVPAVAVAAAIALIPASWRRTGAARDRRVRWMAYWSSALPRRPRSARGSFWSLPAAGSWRWPRGVVASERRRD